MTLQDAVEVACHQMEFHKEIMCDDLLGLKRVLLSRFMAFAFFEIKPVITEIADGVFGEFFSKAFRKEPNFDVYQNLYLKTCDNAPILTLRNLISNDWTCNVTWCEL